MNSAGRQIQMRDAAVIIVLCALAVLTAGALSMGGRLRVKTLMCQKNLREIGRALGSYADAYDGALPTLERSTSYPPRIEHYYIIRREDPSGSGKYPWYHLGCLYSGGFIDDGRTFYCPAASGSLDEYLSYCDPAPWGVLPQNGAVNAVNQWIRTWRGYVYWPQSTSIVQTNPAINYKVGYPNSATSLSNLDKSKSVVSDIVFHREGQFKVNALFWDGSVIYQDGPNAADSSRLYYHIKQFDDAADYAAGWTQVTIAEWMWQLHK